MFLVIFAILNAGPALPYCRITLFSGDTDYRSTQQSVFAQSPFYLLYKNTGFKFRFFNNTDNISL